MGFKNSILYVQKKMDSFLRPYRYFARCYIDNIVIFSRSAEEYFDYLRVIFALFAKLKITLKSKKFYFGYSSVILFGQKIDGFGFTITEERIAVIREMRFPETLEVLETYVEITNWLRKNVRYFIQISESLQTLKTELFKRSFSQKERPRRNYAKITKILFIDEKMEVFEVFQKILIINIHFHHYDQKR